MLGHKGCLYSHIEFLLRSVGQTDCLVPRYLHSLRPDPNLGAVSITITNGAAMPLRVYRLDTEGQEQLEPQISAIPPLGTVEIATGVNEVWRFRAEPPATADAATQLPERLLGEVLVDRYPATREFVITDCPTLEAVAAPDAADDPAANAAALKGAVMFEDDIVFDDDFVSRFLKASAALPDDWDVLMLNWYCMGTHSVDTSKLPDISERLKAEMQKMHQPADEAGRRMQQQPSQPHGEGSAAPAEGNREGGGATTDSLLQELLGDHILKTSSSSEKHPGHTLTGSPPPPPPPPPPNVPKNPSSWTQWCEKNRGTPEIIPGSGLVRAHFFMSGSACESERAHDTAGCHCHVSLCGCCCGGCCCCCCCCYC
eukprot:COSAG06_NODE_2724_length_6384_cov_81.190135_2_plen_370_part_00